MIYNTVIIGAGPAGMAAALYLKRGGLSVILIDKDAPGGQMLKTSVIENYLGYTSINGADLSLKMYEQIKANEIPLEFGKVISVEKNKHFHVKTNDKDFECENVIIATGRTPNKLDFESVRGISYCAVCDGSFYKDMEVGVVGGGNSAFTNAIYLSHICKKVYVLVRNKIRATHELVEKASKISNIIILEKKEIKEIISQDNELKGVILNDDKKLDIKGLFIAIGGTPQIDFISDIELENGYIKVDENKETSCENIYAVGDVIAKDFYQIITAMNDGVIAALNIQKKVTDK